MAITVPLYPPNVLGGGEGFTGPPEIQFPIHAEGYAPALPDYTYYLYYLGVWNVF